MTLPLFRPSGRFPSRPRLPAVDILCLVRALGDDGHVMLQLQAAEPINENALRAGPDEIAGHSGQGFRADGPIGRGSHDALSDAYGLGASRPPKSFRPQFCG